MNCAKIIKHKSFSQSVSFLRLVCLFISLFALFEGVVYAQIQAGTASKLFELPDGVPLAGYSRRGGKPSQGILDPVGVRALVIKDESSSLAIVSADLLIIDQDMYQAVNKLLLEKNAPFQPALLLAATHTHSGPGAYGSSFLEKISMGHFDVNVFDALVEQIAQTILDAAVALTPIHIGCGVVETEHLIANRIHDNGPVDSGLRVCAVFHDQKTIPEAILVNYSAHPTTLGAWNMQLSGDYPGVVMNELQKFYPQSVNLFLAGSVGDQGPIKEGERFESMQRIGKKLAEQTRDLIRRIGTETPNRLKVLEDTLTLDGARVRVGSVNLPRWLGRTLVGDDAHIVVAVLDHTVFIGVPCDMTYSLGERLQTAARSHDWTPLIISFANDYIGYCIPEDMYDSGEYEATMAFNGPYTGERIVNRLVEMMDQLADDK